MSVLGSLLRRHREAAGLTQEELADRAGVSARTISDIERGLRTRVYDDTARRIEAALELPADAAATFLESARGRRSSARGPGLSSTSVPRPLTPLLGRDREVDDLVRALSHDSPTRLVTVTGLGGVGKTRLALAVAAALEDAYEVRVHVLSIAANQDASHVVDAVARALGAPDPASPETVAAHLGTRPTLLVIDTFEHVLDAAPDIERVLSAAPTLRVLATSRRRLGIPGEREVALPPLAVPMPSDPHWAQTPAATLFVDRVRAHTPDLRLESAAEAETVVEICRRLSGMPLALELAAARVRHLPLNVLRDRLRRGMSDLADTATGLPDRHRSMERVLAWSTETLSSDEARVLDAASLFVDGWRLDALQRLCGDTADLVGTMSSLVDAGLVLLDRSPGAPSDTPRWRMLDVVRDFLRGAEADDVSEEFRAGYVGFYLDLVDQAQGHVGREHEWYRLLDTEEPNLRTALTWAAEAHDAETLLRLAGGMWRFWQARGDLLEGRRWLQTGLDLQPPAADATRMTAWWGVGWLAYHQGDDEAAEAAASHLEELARRRVDQAALRNALTIHGMIAISHGRPQDAVGLLAECLGIARGLGPGWILATSLLNLGMAHLADDDVERARACLAEALTAYEELGDERFRARCLGYLGLASLLEGDPTRASALFRQSLVAFAELGEPEGTAEALAGFAAVAAATGDAHRAARLAGASQWLHQSYAGRALPMERRAVERYLSSAQSTVGPQTWEEELQRGRDLSRAAAVELALGERG